MKHQLMGKRILAVDDEPDILETLSDALDMCEVETADSFDSAKRLLVNKDYDAVILDIMGVNGYDLLNLAKIKGIPALMLTAHALSPEHLQKSIAGGACCYLPKEKMIDIAEHLGDMLSARAAGRPAPHAWFDKLSPCFERKWGANWQDGHIETLKRLNLVHSKDELERIL